MRQLASIQRITNLEQIPGADRIVTASILGWKVIVKKDDFKVGDLCVFFEIDSIIPAQPWNEFLCKGKENFRLRTVKMKGQISQGLAIPLSIYPEGQEGEDVSEILGVTKTLIKELPAVARGTRPHWVPKTDELRVQSIPWIVDYFYGKEVYVTQKLDGSSISVANGVICSRNMLLKNDSENNFTREGLKLKIPEGFLIQGELVGPGIQKNRLGLSEHQIFVFNVFHHDKLLSYAEMCQFCGANKIQMVPFIAVGSFLYKSIDELLTLAQLGTYQNGHPQEGIVIRPVVPEQHPKIGMLSFKVINNEYLLKVGE